MADLSHINPSNFDSFIPYRIFFIADHGSGSASLNPRAASHVPAGSMIATVALSVAEAEPTQLPLRGQARVDSLLVKIDRYGEDVLRLTRSPSLCKQIRDAINFVFGCAAPLCVRIVRPVDQCCSSKQILLSLILVALSPF